MKKPSIPAYGRHVILCAGKACDTEQKRELMQYLKQRLVAEGLTKGEDAVRANRGGCLGVCDQGAIMVVYPEGTWYCNMNEANIDRFIEEHLKQGRVLEDLLFHVAG